MIRAVVLLAEWDHDKKTYPIKHPDEPPPRTPPELLEWWRFRKYGLPPLAGGMRDQPIGWMERCETMDSIYRAWVAWLTGDKSPEWRKQHPDDNRIAQHIRKEIYGGR